jgi:uncharacterized Zn-finger protein
MKQTNSWNLHRNQSHSKFTYYPYYKTSHINEVYRWIAPTVYKSVSLCHKFTDSTSGSVTMHIRRAFFRYFCGWPFVTPTAVVLQQFLFSHRRGAFKAPSSFNFWMSAAGRSKKNALQSCLTVAYGVLTGTSQLLSGSSTIFSRSVSLIDCVRL